MKGGDRLKPVLHFSAALCYSPGPMTERLVPPTSGTRIGYENNKLVVPDDPIIPYIEGDGTGPDIWRATRVVVDGVVEKMYGGKRKIAWHEVFAGDKAFEMFGEYLPQETLDHLA